MYDADKCNLPYHLYIGTKLYCTTFKKNVGLHQYHIIEIQDISQTRQYIILYLCHRVKLSIGRNKILNNI